MVKMKMFRTCLRSGDMEASWEFSRVSRVMIRSRLKQVQDDSYSIQCLGSGYFLSKKGFQTARKRAHSLGCWKPSPKDFEVQNSHPEISELHRKIDSKDLADIFVGGTQQHLMCQLYD